MNVRTFARCFHIASTPAAHGSSHSAYKKKLQHLQYITGASEEIRTPDPQIRSLVLSPDTYRHSPSAKHPRILIYLAFMLVCALVSQTHDDTSRQAVPVTPTLPSQGS